MVALTGDMPHELALAERQALTVTTPIAVGLYAWREGTHARFGRLLVLAGGAWFLAGLSSSSNELVYSIGRVAGWTVEAGLIYLILAFPSGRLTTTVDRRLALATGLLVVLLFLPTALIVESYPSITLFATCSGDCPQNAFMLLDSEPAWLDSVLIPLRELLASLLFIAVVVRLGQRIHRATRLMRRTLLPVLVVAMIRTLTIVIAFGLRRAGVDDSVLYAVTTVTVLGLPVMCAAFFVGLVGWRIYTADCLLALARGLRSQSAVTERRDLIAATLTDPTVELAFFRTGASPGWVDADGRPTSLLPPPADRLATLIFDGRGPVAAVLHDAALGDQRSFVEAVGTYAFVWEENRRLAADVESSLTELRASRARILAAADDERQRIERDLHDGGQQRLVALRIRLELAGGHARRGPHARAQRCSIASAATWTRRWPSSARWPPAYTPRCSPLAGSPTQSGLPRCSRRFPRWWRSKAPTATQARSRPPPTSAASRRSRTSPSTRPRRVRCGSRSTATATCASRCATTARASIRAAPRRAQVSRTCATACRPWAVSWESARARVRAPRSWGPFRSPRLTRPACCRSSTAGATSPG